MLAHWGNFYVIAGTAGGTLIGLMFVVITLVSSIRRRITEDSLDAFATPTVVHFSVVLGISIVMSVPWSSTNLLAAVIALCGVLGVVYFIVGVQRSRAQTVYQVVWEDWLWYAILPGLGYAVLTLAGVLMLMHAESALYIVAGVVLAFLVIGIRNAWDTVVHLVTTSGDAGKEPAQ